MKNIPSIFLLWALSLFLATQASAKNIDIGKGSGSLVINAMGGSLDIAEGDTLTIATGTYSEATFVHLKNVTIVPAEGGVIMKGAISIGDDTNVTFDGTVLSGEKYPYGFVFSGPSFAFTPATNLSPRVVGNTQNVTIKGILCQNNAGLINGANVGLVYDGTPATALYYNLAADTVKLTGAAVVYLGTYAQINAFQDVNIGMTLKNFIVVNDGTGAVQKVNGRGIYNMVADHWVITGPTKTWTGDMGVFYVEGNCTLKNIYRNGGWGWLMRIFNCSLYTPSTSYVYNCIDVNTVSYGTIETRVTADFSKSIPLVGNDMKIYNVTSGNKGNVTKWTSNLCIGLGNSDHATPTPHIYETDIVNCLAFNNTTLDHNSLYEDASDGPKIMVKSNNVTIEGPLPDGYLADTEKFYPANNKDNPLIGKGKVVPETATDIYGNPRGDSYDIGAVQHREDSAAQEPDKADAFLGHADLSTNLPSTTPPDTSTNSTSAPTTNTP